ncbi:M13 family metallopeptidase, partial [Bacteroides sp. OttesenSCG-928-M17]|nr:M13 family metallopeptidase [Bacteroides sp. OttesenSCG-928-M17]
MDTIVHPGNDFYQYAGGGWMANNPLKDSDVDRDAFAIVQDSVNDRLKRIITTLAAGQHQQGSIEQKIADLYNLAMDSVKLNNEGYGPIKPLFDRIEAISQKDEIIPMIIELGKVEASPYFVYAPLPDMANSNMQLLAINQGGLGLGQKEYYLIETPELVYIREEYKKYIVNLFKLMGFSEQDAIQKMEGVIDIEMNIAQASLSNVEVRDLQANYHKMSVEELKSTVPDFNWDLFFAELGLTNIQSVDLRQIEPMKNVASILHTVPVSKHVAYLQYALLKAASGYLSDDFLFVNFNFFGKLLLGRGELSPRWKRSIGSMEEMLGEPIGQLYVKEYFSPESKQRVLGMVKNLQDVLADRIEAQTWMSDSTKTKAIDKLNAFSIKIGYPDKWIDYSTLIIDNNDSYWSNVCSVKAWEFAEDLKQVGKPVDKA